jgi:RecJ-like exonuclease
MIDLKQIENEIRELKSKLWQKEKEYSYAKESNLKEQYGANFGCDNCAYSCCVDVGDHCTFCNKHKCIYCNDYCDEYMPDNTLSTYIRNEYYYDENTVKHLNNLFDVSDIMQHPELHQKAIDILVLRYKEN